MKNAFSKIILIFMLGITINKTYAQVNANAGHVDGKSIIKVNVPALAFKNFSFQYERAVNQKHSFAIALRYRPASSLPFQKTIQDLFTDTTIRLDLAKIGNFGITPEYRFYLGKKGVFHGLYLGVFASYNYYYGDVPLNYYDYVNNHSVDKIAVFKGSMNTLTAGVQIGGQWKLSEKLNVDIWIAGPNYGINRGTFKFAGALNPSYEQPSLFYRMDFLRQTVPLINIEIPQGSPNDNGASFKTSGPWAGIRAFGLNLGYRF
jgi:hypothetical protein